MTAPTPWRVQPCYSYTQPAIREFPRGQDIIAADGSLIASCNVFAEEEAALLAAAPELLRAQTFGASVNTPDFLDWLADRLVNIYNESPNVDFVISLRERAAWGRAAIAKATGKV